MASSKSKVGANAMSSGISQSHRVAGASSASEEEKPFTAEKIDAAKSLILVERGSDEGAYSAGMNPPEQAEDGNDIEHRYEAILARRAGKKEKELLVTEETETEEETDEERSDNEDDSDGSDREDDNESESEDEEGESDSDEDDEVEEEELSEEEENDEIKMEKFLNSLSKPRKEEEEIDFEAVKERIRTFRMVESKDTDGETILSGKTDIGESSSNRPEESSSSLMSRSSYARMQLMVLEKELAKIDKESSSVEKNLKSIRSKGGNNHLEEERCIQKWLTLVHKKNELLRRQAKLNIIDQEKDLERCYKVLLQKLQPLNSLEDWEKTDSQRETEKLLLDQLLRVVEKRNELVHHLDTEEKAEAEDKMVMKETQGPLNPNATEPKCIVS